MEWKADKEPVKPEDDSIEPLNAISSLSLSVAFGAWAEPDMELFGFEAFESSMSFSLPEDRGFVLSETKRTITTDSSLSPSVDYESWTESTMVDFGFNTLMQACPLLCAPLEFLHYVKCKNLRIWNVDVSRC
jgi:hypothetical protein